MNEMIDLYLIRHAESTANLNPELICGQSTDIELTELGVDQARNLGSVLRGAGIMPDVVHVSPAVRARRTAEHALATAGITIEPTIDPRLHEVSQGEWEGLVRKEMWTPAVLQRASELKGDFKVPGGESITEARARLFDYFDDLVSLYGDSEALTTVFAFSHGFITRTAAGHFLGWTPEQARSHEITPNASISLFPYDGANWNVAYVGQHEFLPPDREISA